MVKSDTDLKKDARERIIIKSIEMLGGAAYHMNIFDLIMDIGLDDELSYLRVALKYAYTREFQERSEGSVWWQIGDDLKHSATGLRPRKENSKSQLFRGRPPLVADTDPSIILPNGNHKAKRDGWWVLKTQT
jgi:hypothetical protein